MHSEENHEANDEAVREQSWHPRRPFVLFFLKFNVFNLQWVVTLCTNLNHYYDVVIQKNKRDINSNPKSVQLSFTCVILTSHLHVWVLSVHCVSSLKLLSVIPQIFRRALRSLRNFALKHPRRSLSLITPARSRKLRYSILRRTPCGVLLTSPAETETIRTSRFEKNSGSRLKMLRPSRASSSHANRGDRRERNHEGRTCT